MKIVPWVIAAIACILAVTAHFKAPKEVIREVPKEVIKEVPVEVIKRVPFEVIKEVTRDVPVEVVKEVEKALTDDEKIAIARHKAVLEAKQDLKQSSRLKDIEKVSVRVMLNELMSKKWAEDEIRVKLTLELRRIGVEVLPTTAGAEATVDCFVDGMATEGEGGITFFTVKIEVKTAVTSMLWDDTYHAWLSSIWTTADYGFFGSAKIKEAQRNTIESVSARLASDYLEANPIRRK